MSETYLANEAECETVGIDPVKVHSLIKKLNQIGKECDALNITVFGGSGGGSLRKDDGGDGALVLGDIRHGRWDGGDGACIQDANGLMRGEGSGV